MTIMENNCVKDNIRSEYNIKRWFYLVYGTILMFSISICYAWSIFNAPIVVEYPSWSELDFSLVFTVFMISNAIMGVVSGIIVKKKMGKPFLNYIIGSTLLILAFIITSISNSVFLLMLGFGFFGGAGVAFCYNATIITITRWFPDKVGFSTGMLLMGYGLGSFVIGKIYSSILLSGISWRNIFFVIGIILFIISLIASFIIKLPKDDFIVPLPKKPIINKEEIETIELPPLKMIKRSSFILIFIGIGVLMLISSMGITSNARNIVQYVDSSIELDEIATIVGLISIMNAIGRISIGFFHDKLGLRFALLSSSIFFVLSIVLIAVATFNQNIVFLTLSYILFGLSSGMIIPNGAIIIKRFYGISNYGINLQVMMLSGVFNSLGAVIVGLVQGMTLNYYAPVFVLSIIASLGLILVLFIKRP